MEIVVVDLVAQPDPRPVLAPNEPDGPESLEEPLIVAPSPPQDRADACEERLVVVEDVQEVAEVGREGAVLVDMRSSSTASVQGFVAIV